TILVAIFLAFFVFGVLIFSGILKIGGGSSGVNGISGKVIIWGILPDREVGELFKSINGSNPELSVSYVEQKSENYEQNLIEAFAKDQGPDLFILPSDMVLRNVNFTSTIPFTSYPKKAFDNTFIDGASIYLTQNGVLGYPLLVDPLVLYYNKDMLSNENIVYPPATWDELFDLSSKLIKKNKDGTISQSMIALGQYDNVNHTKDILSMLLLQSNNPIAVPVDKGYRSTIKDTASDGSNPMEQIVNFFLEFSNPSNVSYSWNRSMPNSLDMFTSGKLAFYIGYGSELFNIESVNPNLSFNVAEVPQTKGMNIRRTYGNIHSVFVSKKSANVATAQSVSAMMTDPAFLKELSIRTSLPTASRSLLKDKPADPYLSTFFDSAIISRSWLDPNKDQTDSIFKELIENSLSNKLSVSSSISKAYNQLDLILKNIYE
ncbi:MAG: Extracellular solute-binding protein family 1, partial [Candidatus Nomurabacteria bacterium GW2011_GWC2_36_9]